jgi:CHAD domain-containing protein
VSEHWQKVVANTGPVEVGKVLETLLAEYAPAFDPEDQLKRLITKLAAHSGSRGDAILCLEFVRYLPGMIQLYSQLKAETVSDAK